MLPTNIQSALRLALQKAQAKFPDMIMSIGTLRMETAIASTQNNYNFILKDPGQQPADGTIQQRLNDNDAFICVAVALNLKKFTTASPGEFPLFTMPDRSYFTAAGQAAALESVYNGSIQFKTASTVRIDGISTSTMRYAPNSQYKLANPGTPVTPFGLQSYSPGIVNAEYGPTWEKRGYVDIVNYPIIDGSEQNLWTLTLGTATLTAVGTDVNLTLFNAGILIKGGGASAKRWNTPFLV